MGDPFDMCKNDAGWLLPVTRDGVVSCHHCSGVDGQWCVGVTWCMGLSGRIACTWAQLWDVVMRELVLARNAGMLPAF